MTEVRWWLIAAFLCGGMNASAARAVEVDRGDLLCSQASDWTDGASVDVKQMTPMVVESDAGRTYHFDLHGSAGLQTLDASCGWGSYAECVFTARRSDGGTYQFSDLSSFGLWRTTDGLYLVYRIVSPKAKTDARKRRVVKLGNPPKELCNQIGDYSDLM